MTDDRVGRSVPIHTRDMREGVSDPRAVAACWRAPEARAARLIQGWMYHSKLIASLASTFSTKAPVVWGDPTTPATTAGRPSVLHSDGRRLRAPCRLIPRPD